MIYISDMNLNNHRSITLLIISHLIISNLLSFLLAKRISPNAKIGFFFFLFTNKKSSWLQVRYVLKSNVIKPNNWEKVITLLKLKFTILAI